VERFGIFAVGQVHGLIFSSRAVSIDVDAVAIVDDPVSQHHQEVSSQRCGRAKV
jgi:hypothetical protein